MASDFLIKPLNEMFGHGARGKPKSKPATKVVATYNDVEYEVAKWRNGLWGVNLDGQQYTNSKLGDLILQLEHLGATVERRAAR